MGVQHWSFLVIEWSWVLALRQRSLRELSPFDIMWSQEVSGVPMPWTRLSHLRCTGLTPGRSTKTLSATRLLVLQDLLKRWGVPVAHCGYKDMGNRSSGKYSLAWALLESPIINLASLNFNLMLWTLVSDIYQWNSIMSVLKELHTSELLTKKYYGLYCLH